MTCRSVFPLCADAYFNRTSLDREGFRYQSQPYTVITPSAVRSFENTSMNLVQEGGVPRTEK